MSNFIRKSDSEIKKMSVKEFCEYMEEWNAATKEKWGEPVLTEGEHPKFDSFEEVKKYYGGITIEEFEQKYLMRDE